MRLLPRYRRAARALTAVTLAGVLGASGAAPYISTLPIAAYADREIIVRDGKVEGQED